MKKQSIFFLVIIVAVAVFVTAGQKLIKQPVINPNTINSPNRQVTLSQDNGGTSGFNSDAVTGEGNVTVDFSDGRKLVQNISAQTAYDALVQITKNNNLTLEAKEYKYGRIVTKIGDKGNSGGSYWMYLVNGKTASIAADHFLIYPKDKVEWIYKK